MSPSPTMGLSLSWLFTYLSAVVYLVSAQNLTHTVAVLPDGHICPTPYLTTVSIVPVYVSTYIPGPTQIEIFGDGNTVIFNGPTTIITSTIITTTIYPTATVTTGPSITGPPNGGGMSSGGSFSGSSMTSIPGSSSLSPGSSSGPASTSGSGSGSRSTSSTSLLSGTSSSGQPPVTSPSATPTTSSTTFSYSEPTATLGQGLPTGVFTSLPEGQGPVLLGFAGRIPNRVRRQASASPTATATGYIQEDGDAAPGCGYAARWSIEGGMLMSDNATVGKARGALYAAIKPSETPMEVNTTFYFTNGILGWNTTDVGPASFYSCGGDAYAGFPAAPFSNCSAITIGGVDADVCPVDISDMEPPSSTSSTVQSSIGASASSNPSPPVTSSSASASTNPSTPVTSSSASSIRSSTGMGTSSMSSLTSSGVRSSSQGTIFLNQSGVIFAANVDYKNNKHCFPYFSDQFRGCKQLFSFVCKSIVTGEQSTGNVFILYYSQWPFFADCIPSVHYVVAEFVLKSIIVCTRKSFIANDVLFRILLHIGIVILYEFLVHTGQLCISNEYFSTFVSELIVSKRIKLYSFANNNTSSLVKYGFRCDNKWHFLSVSDSGSLLR
ncbi:hypothetical protein EPUS_04691 [Endocarpon pusillum Z07020]|uniref:DUF7908 domain-containing protein n=1 Tax=Endocarpon pusillum (strain Z07020 / HMAS-L-300199) TaxID=1263415 RepID=U1G9C6_ENDPU|nr:uncharacterized protein EPUS_04691 [Endocarpon pusillum Z07020]ERF68593.1 hypothetical protein EPUS_04691 [Endocarpon pusillum Z07020]